MYIARCIRGLVTSITFIVSLAFASGAAATPTLSLAWRLNASGDRSYLTTGDLQRGMALNPTTNHLLVASRTSATAGSIVIINAADGSDTGASLNLTGVSGGFSLFNTIAVASDGAIYAANLTLNAGTSAFKIYRWANESAAPIVAYSGNPLGGSTAGRWGDAIDAIGSGTGTILAAGRGTAGDVSAVALYNTADGVSFSAVNNFPGSTGNYRGGVALGAAGELYGKENGDSLRRGTYDTTTLVYTETNNYPTASFSSAIAPIDIDPATRLMAALATSTHTVSIWDATDTTNPPVLFDSVAIVGAANTNGNAAGSVIVDSPNGRIYVLDTNNGIAAYSIPEPATAGVIAVAAIGCLYKRRRD